MEFRNLMTFSKIAEYKSFSKAAQSLGYAQSTATMQIKQLEKEIDAQLFERIGKKVFLTEKGKKLLDYANEIIHLYQEAQNAMKEDELPYGEIRIGVVESLCVSILPNIVIKCNASCPNVELVVKIATTSELVDMLKSNEVDMILTLDNKQENSKFVTMIEHPEKTFFVSGPQHSLVKRRKLSLLDIIDETFIMPEKGCNCRQLLEEKLSKYDKTIEPNVFLEIGSTEIIKSFVENNLAISMLPEIAISNDIKNGRIAILNIVDFEIDVWIQLIYHKNKYITPAMSSILSIINEEVISNYE